MQEATMTIYRLTGRTGPIPVEVEHEGGRFLLTVDASYLQLTVPCTWAKGCTRPAAFAEPATDDGTSAETELMCSEHVGRTYCEGCERIATHTVAHDCAGDRVPHCSAENPCGERLYRCDECDPDDDDPTADRRALEPVELPR